MTKRMSKLNNKRTSVRVYSTRICRSSSLYKKRKKILSRLVGLKKKQMRLQSGNLEKLKNHMKMKEIQF